MKTKVATYAALGGALISLSANAIATLKGEQYYKPRRYTKQTEFDEYWDIIKYLKWTGVAEKAKKMALERSGIDIDILTKHGDRQDFARLDPWAALAIQAEKEAKRTMYGYDQVIGNLSEALASIPRRHRQIAEEIIMYGSEREKEEFYGLLPDSEKRVLGKFLGVSLGDLPAKPNLSEYFKTHFLPDPNWEGWGLDVDLDDLETRSAAREGTQVVRPHRMKVAKARARTQDIHIPRMDNPTYRDIKIAIEQVLRGEGVEANFTLRPSDRNIVAINMNLQWDETKELYQVLNRDEF